MRFRLSDLRRAIRHELMEYRSMAGGGPMRPRRFDVWPPEGYGLNTKPEDDHVPDSKFYGGRDEDAEEDAEWPWIDDEEHDKKKAPDLVSVINNIPNAYASGLK